MEDGLFETQLERLEREHRELKALEARHQQRQNRRMTRLTAGLILIGVVGIPLTIWQAATADKSANAAKSAAAAAEASLKRTEAAFHIEQRPYVWVRTFKLDQRELFPERASSVTVYIKNAGRSPAVHLSTGQDIDRHCLVGTDAARLFDGGEIAILPVQLEGAVLTSDEEQYFPVSCPVRSSPTDVVLVYGVMTYSDLFNEPHRTDYCARIVPPNDVIEWCRHNNKVE
jgi:hypothetical protein